MKLGVKITFEDEEEDVIEVSFPEICYNNLWRLLDICINLVELAKGNLSTFVEISMEEN